MIAKKEKGSILLTIALGATVLLGACGMAVDIGRMYIVRNELQMFADAAALTAALRLNAESSGIQRARDEVNAMRSVNRWQFSSTDIPAMATTVASSPGVVLDFGYSTTGTSPSNWSANPGNPLNYSFARVIVKVDVPVYFMSVLSGQFSSPVAARAIAGQLPATNPSGYFPFTPIAHDPTSIDFGFTPKEDYTLRWASSPKLQGPNPNVCKGDRHKTWVDLAETRGADNRGFFGDQSNASLIWDQVANDAPVQQFKVGDYIPLTGGAKSTVKDALEERINQDYDTSATTFDGYKDQGHMRRIVTVPVSNPSSSPPNQIVGFARFFLKTAPNYANAQGNEPWCAEYIGPAAPEGSDSQGAGSAGTITKVRLWE